MERNFKLILESMACGDLGGSGQPTLGFGSSQDPEVLRSSPTSGSALGMKSAREYLPLPLSLFLSPAGTLSLF